MNNQLCSHLLKTWCEALLSLQIKNPDQEGIHGAILCPACALVHGRCLEAIYPFLYLADVCQDERFLTGAKRLFNWAERTVSRPDGSYVNDSSNEWKGTTVFTVIQLAEALTFHGHILDAATKERWTERIAKAAEFLYHFDEINHNNINYLITNALAMEYCGQLLHIPEYQDLAAKNAAVALSYLSSDFLLFGEGQPSDGRTLRGCRAVDLGYNVEESLPSLAAYAHLTGNVTLMETAQKALEAHLMFFLPDGGLDNSFGTRNFKWTYWGSRTADGCAFGYLLAAGLNPSLATAAIQNLKLLEECTHDGLLYGGPHNHIQGERACVHHSFAHAKVLANILNHNLELPDPETAPPLPRVLLSGIKHYPDIDSYLVNRSGMLATVTAGDWEYLPGGHSSGGNLTMLWHPASGPLLCASMSEYQMKEPLNMQLPRFQHHECLSPALEYTENACRYTSLYDFCADLSPQTTEEEDCITVEGHLEDIHHNTPQQPCLHSTSFRFREREVQVSIRLNLGLAQYVCPLISCQGEPVNRNGNRLTIEKNRCSISLEVTSGHLFLPYSEIRCYNLVPGLQAIKTVITPEDSKIEFTIKIIERKD